MEMRNNMSKRRRYDDDYYYPYYERTTPIKTKGGMKVKSKRGEIASKWWSKRLIAILGSYGWTNRLERGRRYARSGQVLRINIGSGVVDAEVQGSRPAPYKINIRFPTTSDESWKTIFSIMLKKPEFVSHMLTGEIPPEIEDVFRESQSPLFPKRSSEIEMKCSCPDYANPCKHIAAVFYVLADSLDDDPFLLFQLKGKSKEEIMSAISSKDSGKVQEGEKDEAIGVVPDPELLRFWNPPPVNVQIESKRNLSISPLKKYPLPSDFDDPLIQSILSNYFDEIEKSVLRLRPVKDGPDSKDD